MNDIEIDGAFVGTPGESREDRIFVKTITDVAEGLNERVAAKLMEDARILSVSIWLGVRYARGYRIRRPVPIR